MSRGVDGPLPIYESHPPEWLRKAHSSSDLGYAGFFPPRPDQVEESLTENNVKNGLHIAPQVSAETLSARDTVQERLAGEDVLEDLNDLMNQIFARRAETTPAIPSSSFRLPSRVTLNETKRLAWFTDLANPDVPLHKLGKSVPHGAKGHDLLDLLHTKNVAIPRAVWFLRVFGGNETAGLRNKPTLYNPTQYSIDWAIIMNGYLKKQLLEIALPMAPRPGFGIKQTFKGVLSDRDSRERWISRFSYSLQLLRNFYAEGLVDNRTFLAWLIHQLYISNLAQLGFIARLVDEFMEGIVSTRALTRPTVEACLNRLSEIKATPAQDHLVNLENILKTVLMRALLALPNAFVNPKTWLQHSSLLREIVVSYNEDGALGTSTELSVSGLQRDLVDSFINVKRRNEAILFKDLPTRPTGPLSSALHDIKLLNSLSGSTDIESILFFDTVLDESPAFAQKLDILLTWSVTPLQYGDHRPYAAASLLRCWRERAGERAIRRDRTSPDEFIQDQLFDWLDNCEVAAEPGNLSNLALLFGELVKHGLFSYPMYVQRLIARGERGLSSTETDVSRHRNFLRWIPLQFSSSALIMQRKVTLYGVRARKIKEDEIEKEIRKEIRAMLPELFDGESLPIEALTDGLESSCKLMYSAPRFEQVRIVREWLFPILKKKIASQANVTVTDGPNPVTKIYSVSTVLMAHCKCYGSILDLTLFALEQKCTHDLLTIVIDTLRQHVEVWACMNALGRTTEALLAAHQDWKANSATNLSLLDLLIEFDNMRYLDPGVREQIHADRALYKQALHPTHDEPNLVPPALPEILMMAQDSRPDAPSNLAKSLWYKYRTATDWAWKVWDNTMASLHNIPDIFADQQSRTLCALRYAAFLTYIEHHLPSGLDDTVIQWFAGPGGAEMATLTQASWDVVTIVLLYLVVHGALSTVAILKGLVYPSWRAGAEAESVAKGSSLATLLLSVDNICKRLLLGTECGNDYPPADFFEARGLQTRRRDVYREPHFALLMHNLPFLVLLEENINIPPNARKLAKEFRRDICNTCIFRQGVYRDLDTVNLAFEKVLEDDSVPTQVHEALIKALNLVLNEGYSDTGGLDCTMMSASALTPWKLAATFMENRFSMKQLSSALTRDITRKRANDTLDQMAARMFQQDMTAEQSDFVAEMMKGITLPVAQKLISAGLRRLTALLKDPRYASMENSASLISVAGEVLRLLISITKSLRDNEQTIPELEPSGIMVDEGLFTEIVKKLRFIMNFLKPSYPNGDETGNVSRLTMFLARIIHFVLALPSTWTTQFRGFISHYSVTLTALITLFGSGNLINEVLFPLLVDTLCLVLDEVPVDLKQTSITWWLWYPEIGLQTLPLDMPLEYQRQFRSMLSFVSPNPAVASLAYVSQDPSGQTSITPVQNRPWDWTEHLGEPSPTESKPEDKDKEEPTIIKNSASLPLELFAARTTGEQIVIHDDDARTEYAITTFQDDVASGSVFHRDWRETRAPHLLHPDRAELDDEVGPLPTFKGMVQGTGERHSNSRRPSPASSIRSRGSAGRPPSGLSSHRQSPSNLTRFTGSTAGDAIDVDSLDFSATGSKRKSAPSDDEIEIIEGPVPLDSRRAKGKIAVKPRPSKKR
ncbi:hypothetical protein QCA50_004525 [Cerrena zonata]|uniref:Mediator of RNA polymerase II transcription subunit 12 n=1 Tax=Cerrena zonata TaxID=2478898 RepID=A0AAW0GU45_9APHY